MGCKPKSAKSRCEPKRTICGKKQKNRKNTKWEKLNLNKPANATGVVQYFYHYPGSKLPIRDVAVKTEPHIEIGAENYLFKCYQRNVKRFVSEKRKKWRGKYLFLVTTCKNKELNREFGKNKTNQFIVGYITKEEAYNNKEEGRVCMRGTPYLYSFNESILTKDIFKKNFAQSENKEKTLSLVRNPFVTEEETRKILNHFKDKIPIEVKTLIQEMKNCEKKEKKVELDNVCYDKGCDFRRQCLRRDSK